jgi:hypothetical protein
MQHLPLIFSLLALTTGGYAIVSQPSTESKVETDDMVLKALQEEMAGLRQDLYNMKNTGGEAPAAPPRMDDSYGKGSGDPGSIAAPSQGNSMQPPMPEMPEMDPETIIPPDPILAGQIRMVMRQERQKYRDKRVGRHLERFAEELNERLANHEATNSLSEEDSDALSQILHKERKSMGKLYRGIRSGDMTPKDARQELQAMRADTLSIVRESMGDDLANSINVLSPLPERGPLAKRK